MAVCESCGLDQDRGDDAGLPHLAVLVLLCRCLGEVGHVSLYFLVVLLTIAGVGVVGVLDAVDRYGLLVAEHHLAVIAFEIQLVEHALQKAVIDGLCLKVPEDGLYEIAYCL